MTSYRRTALTVVAGLAWLSFGSAQPARAGGGIGGCFPGCAFGESCLDFGFGFGFCCPAAQVCFGTTCCFPGSTCTAVGCCLDAQVCGSSCCSPGQTCEGGSTCVDPTPTPTTTPTLTDTPTQTPTHTPVPIGGSCIADAQCASAHCADDVCCDTACADPLQQCNVPGQVGTCTSGAAPAPALAPRELLVAVALLIVTAAWGLRRRTPGT